MEEKATKVMVIDWLDSCVYHDWRAKNEKRVLSQCQSVGFLVEETKTTVVLALNKTASHFGECVVIPKAVIKKRKVVKV